MKSRIVPVGILGLMIAFAAAQAGNGFVGESTLPTEKGYSMVRDTVPENPQDTMKKKKKKDKDRDKRDTSNLPKPDTFKTSFRP